MNFTVHFFWYDESWENLGPLLTEYVTSNPPVPVVIFDGTGRAADLLAFAHRIVNDDGRPTEVFHEVQDELLHMIQETFRQGWYPQKKPPKKTH